MWWCIPIILILGRQKKETHGFEGGLGYKERFQSQWKTKQNQNQLFFLTFYIQPESLSLKQQVLETHYGVSLSHEWTRNVLEYCEHSEGPSLQSWWSMKSQRKNLLKEPSLPWRSCIWNVYMWAEWLWKRKGLNELHSLLLLVLSRGSDKLQGDVQESRALWWPSTSSDFFLVD